MRAIFFLLIVFISSPDGVTSQSRGRDKLSDINVEMFSKQQAQALRDTLRLSKEQEERITTIYIEFNQNILSLENRAAPERKTEISKLMADRELRIKDALSDEKYKLYRKLIENMTKNASSVPAKREG
ncbi:MAG TPA: hypothetical protein PLM81_12330 [Ginsengibacter sp.]|nr:hypothetical protein [Ginsengibacter sp.]HRP30844.1 hypothetical protein [Agriterribacter sp.]